jgi:DNA-directed RNA polymerase specialized sigma24 family protein
MNIDEAKHELKNYRYKRKALEKAKEEYLRIFSSLTSGTSSLSLAPAHSSAGHDAQLIALINKRDKLIERHIEQLDYLDKITNKIMQLDGLHAAVLEHRYVDGWEWRRIATALGYSEDNIKGYIHGKALNYYSKLNTF